MHSLAYCTPHARPSPTTRPTQQVSPTRATITSAFIYSSARTVIKAANSPPPRISARTWLSLPLPKLRWSPSNQRRRGSCAWARILGVLLSSGSTGRTSWSLSPQPGGTLAGLSWAHGCALGHGSTSTTSNHDGATAPEARAELRRASSSPKLPVALVFFTHLAAESAALITHWM